MELNSLDAGDTFTVFRKVYKRQYKGDCLEIGTLKGGKLIKHSEPVPCVLPLKTDVQRYSLNPNE